MLKIALKKVTRADNLQFSLSVSGLQVHKCTWVQESNSINLPGTVKMMPTKAKMIACIIKAMNELDHDIYLDEWRETPGEQSYEAYKLARKFYKQWKEKRSADKQEG